MSATTSCRVPLLRAGLRLPAVKYAPRRAVPSFTSPSPSPSSRLARPAINQTRTFTTSFAPQFRGTAATMVVNAIKNRAEYDSAINPASAASGNKLVVIDCFATWCGPCTAIAPKVNEFSDKYSDVAFYKVDVDDAPDVAQELGVRAMPTFVFFKNGQKVDEVLGAVPPALEAAIVKHRN